MIWGSLATLKRIFQAGYINFSIEKFTGWFKNQTHWCPLSLYSREVKAGAIKVSYVNTLKNPAELLLSKNVTQKVHDAHAFQIMNGFMDCWDRDKGGWQNIESWTLLYVIPSIRSNDNMIIFEWTMAHNYSMEWILSLTWDVNSLIVKCEQPRHWSNHGRETDHIRELSVVAMDNNLRKVHLFSFSFSS